MSDRLNQDSLVLQAGYQETMEQEVQPWLESKEQVLQVSGFEDKPISCRLYEADSPRGTVVIVHGFTESAVKYSELIFSLLRNHFSVVAYDQRGHGYSWRKEGLADASVTHVDHFSDYVNDLKMICDHFLPGLPKPWMVFAHSMGGGVTSLFLEQYPDVFSGAVLCAPMIAPNLSGLPSVLVSALCRTACFFGCGKQRPFVAKPYSGPEDFETSCATSRERFAWYDAVKVAHTEYHNFCPSYRWTLESIHVTKEVLAAGAPEGIACPVLLFTADQDFSVMPDPQKEFISRVPKGKHIFVSGSRHEIYRSTDEVLFPWWHEILQFFEEGTEA